LECASSWGYHPLAQGWGWKMNNNGRFFILFLTFSLYFNKRNLALFKKRFVSRSLIVLSCGCAAVCDVHLEKLKFFLFFSNSVNLLL
jgi:hypothetical protein